MPTRILKESITTSERLNRLTPEVEVLFYRLIVVCDDYGLTDARLKVIASRCYPLRELDCKFIEEWLSALDAPGNGKGLIFRYEVDGKPYLKMMKWEKHQQIRAKRSKYPFPENIGLQPCTYAPVIQSNPIQSNPNNMVGRKEKPTENPEFEQAWHRYPKRSGNNPRADAQKAWNARRKEGVTPEAMLAGLSRYVGWCEITGKIGTETVMQAVRFFGKSRPFEQEFTPPAIPGSSPIADKTCAKCGGSLAAGHTKRREGLICNQCESGRLSSPVSEAADSKAIEKMWAAYAGAYEERYDVPPVRNAKSNAIVDQLVKRLGATEAPAVAAFYCRVAKWSYVETKHPLTLLLRDAEGIRTEWATNRPGTRTEAQAADRKQANTNTFGKMIEEAEQQEGGGGIPPADLARH